MTSSKASFNSEELLAIAVRSPKMRKVLEEISADMAKRAESIASTEASATGKFASSFVSGVVNQKDLQGNFRGKSGSVGGQRGRARRKSGAYSDAIEGNYKGFVGVVGTTSFLGWFIEMGTYNRPGKSILQRAATEGGGTATGDAGMQGSRVGKWKPVPKRDSAQKRLDKEAERAFRADAQKLGVTVSKNYFSYLRRNGLSADLERLAKRQGKWKA